MLVLQVIINKGIEHVPGLAVFWTDYVFYLSHGDMSGQQGDFACHGIPGS